MNGKANPHNNRADANQRLEVGGHDCQQFEPHAGIHRLRRGGNRGALQQVPEVALQTAQRTLLVLVGETKRQARVHSVVANGAVHVALLWFALGAKSLRDHIAPIARALGRGDLPEARVLTAKVVSRDTENADEAALSRAAVESALENGNDAIFGALFWFVIAGGPGALMFRLANTLDAMWGYRTPRYLRFGWAAARFDDVLNFVPARLTAASYALLGDTRTAWRCWRTQAPLWDSPNAGPVMASGAGSLNVMLGGAAIYHGTLESRPVLGFGKTAAPRHVVAAMRLVDRTILLWLVVLLACAFLGGGPHG